MLDAAVIGGGPVGLAVAAALLQAREPALDVKVKTACSHKPALHLFCIRSAWYNAVDLR